ncbi:hypothetical protein D3C73_102960 [compost metagenome]
MEFTETSDAKTLRLGRVSSLKIKFKRRLYALLLAMSLMCFGLAVGAAPASAVGSYSNASIADIALTKVGQYGGQCKTFANNMVKQASGNTQWPAPGYHSGFANAGGTEVSSHNAAKGDIIQIGNNDYDYPLHTAIIVANKGGGNFNVVDSNWGLNEIVKQHDFNPYTWAPSGNIKIWRMGTIQTPPPAPDSDGDSVSNDNDTCPTIVGVGSNRGCRQEDHTVSGNFYGNDNYTDTVTFYDYGSSNLGLLLSKGDAEGLGQPLSVWNTGQGQWNWGKSKFLAGNFAGDDTYTDVVGLYNYGNGKLGAFLFRGNGNGVLQPQHLWTTNNDTWSLGSAKYVVGNFSGNDGKDDLMAFYGYADSSQGVFVFPGSNNGIGQAQHQWSSGSQQWNVGSAEYVAGNFANNDGFTDVVAFYQYSGDNMGTFLFQGTSAKIGQPQSLWSTGQNAWNNRSAQFHTGDFYGNDSVTDVVALYDLGNANMGAYVFPGSGTGISQFQNLWTTGAGQWYTSNTKAIVGQFSGSASSIFAWYNYGNSDTGGSLLSPGTTGFIGKPVGKWTTGANQLNWLCM